MKYTFLFMQLTQITDLLAQEVIRPIVDKVFPFSETPKALSAIESGRTKGKVVIQVKA